MLSMGREGFSELRIEEGKVIHIGGSSDPLDGTWTKPDPAWKKLMFIQQGLALIIVFVMFIPIILLPFLIGPDVWFIIWVVVPFYVFLMIVGLTIKWAINKNYDNFRYRITDEELIIESGFLTVNKILIPLAGVQHVKVIETWWGKRYGLKNVIVDTAGLSYMPNPGMMWGGGYILGLRNADQVADAILSRVKKVKARNGSRI